MTEITGLPSVDLSKSRFVGIIWGPVGAGKTPLLMTGRGKKLILMFDIDGWRSISHRLHDCTIEDFSGQSHEVVDQFFVPTSRYLEQLEEKLATGEFGTLVLDSITSVFDMSLLRGIEKVAPSITKGVKPSVIAPGLSGYGARGIMIRNIIMNLHKIAARTGVDFIVTAHEKIDVDDKGIPVEYTMLLGGEAFVQIPKHFSEIWRLTDVDGTKIIEVRPYNKVRSVRTRMFRTDKNYKFPWSFDTYNWTGEGISTWMDEWKDNGYQAVPI
jgi:hypothetical protein